MKSVRRVWTINPKTRCKPKKEPYNRGKQKQKLKKELKEML